MAASPTNPTNISDAIKIIDNVVETAKQSDNSTQLTAIVNVLQSTVGTLKSKLDELFTKLPKSAGELSENLSDQMTALNNQIDVLKSLVPMTPPAQGVTAEGASGKTLLRPKDLTSPFEGASGTATGTNASVGGYRYGKHKSSRKSRKNTHKKKKSKSKSRKSKSRRR